MVGGLSRLKKIHTQHIVDGERGLLFSIQELHPSQANPSVEQ